VVSLKEYSSKILSLQNTRKVTSAMKMIATTRYQKLLKVYSDMVPFENGMRRLLSTLSRDAECTSTPYFKKADSLAAHVVLFTSDRGLCGAHNNNAAKAALALAEELEAEKKSVTITFVGKRGRSKFSGAMTGRTVGKCYEDIAKMLTMDSVQPIADAIVKSYTDGSFGEVWFVYNKYHSPIVQLPVKDKFLPLSKELFTTIDTGNETVDYLYEPDRESLLRSVLASYCSFQVYHTLLTSLVSEFSSRMAAMDAASNNCKTMIENYLLLRNRARQSAITTELTEIVSGKEAQ